MTLPDRGPTTTLEQLVAEIAEGLGEVDASPGGAGRSWSRAGSEFAIAGPFGVEIRLDRQVAAAATRTPDTAPSPRGPDWIRFNPRELDPHALDRLRAWLELGYKRAGE
ncbi:MAG TPA: hypothetical protein VHR16_10105 [Candidatus Limnocylindrales bacterium]|nr:hypothetical protein [Candidatus Limnocylindrales bacterium]